MKMDLEKLEKVDLREVWGHEALDFTKWISQKENLEILGEEIGVEIKLKQTEANVGRFHVDILAEEESTGRIIIIENQLEDTNHDHLGKIITYASGYDAEIVIWVVRDYREEHQKAVAWLNEHTDEKIGFFLIKIELWKIGNSSPAPKFDVIVSPNEWEKALRTSTETRELTETNLRQLEFWTGFKNFVQTKNSQIRLRTPRPQHWYDVSVGNSDAHVALTINSRENLLGCEIYINRNKELFHFLQEKKGQIQNEIGEELEWVDAPVASRIKIKNHVSDVLNPKGFAEYFAWLLEKVLLFQRVFGNYFKEFRR
jgi:hypothetical protein